MSLGRGIVAAFSGRLRQAAREFSGEADRQRGRQERERELAREREQEQAERAREIERERQRERAREREREQPERYRGGPPIEPPPKRRRKPLPPVETPTGPRTDRERDRIQVESLPIWTRDGRIEWVRARDLSSQERKSIVDYWLNVWRFLRGDQRDIGEWTGGAFQIEGHWLETSLDNIEDTVDSVGAPMPSEDLYQEI